MNDHQNNQQQYNETQAVCQAVYSDEYRTERGGVHGFHAVEYVDWGALELEVSGVEERR
jgi:hypothetical protein